MIQTLHIYQKNHGGYHDENKPLEVSGFYLTGYHETPIKIGEMVRLQFKDNITTYKVLDIRFQWWNGDDHPRTNLALGKYKLEETIPSHKNWLKVQPLDEIRQSKLNELGI